MALLAAALCWPAPALADGGSLTVRPSADGDASYRAYRVLAADVDASGRAAGVEWPGDAMRSAVLAHLDASGYGEYLEDGGLTYEGAHDAAQNAAQFIASRIASSADVAGSPPRAKAAGTFAHGLAQALASAGLPHAAVAAGEAAALPQGYYLVVTDAPSVGAGGAATAPVWVAVGESTEVAEKAAVPSVLAEARNSESAAFARATDALCGQEVEHRVTVTLPSNLEAFGSYPLNVGLTFTGLGRYVPGSASVSVDGVDVTAALLAGEGGSAGGTWLSIEDARDPAWGASAGSVVEMRVRTAMATAPNKPGGGRAEPYGECAARLTYPCDPLSPASSKALESRSRVYGFAALLTLTDASTGRPATEAMYSIQVVECADASLSGKYLGGDGWLYDSAVLCRNSESSPVVGFYGLAAGKYRIRQNTLSYGYPRQDSDIVLEIAPAYGADGSLESLSATVTGGYLAASFGSLGTLEPVVDAQLGTVSVDSRVTRIISLPLTGLSGAVPWVAAALGGAGCALAASSRRHGREGSGRRS